MARETPPPSWQNPSPISILIIGTPPLKGPFKIGLIFLKTKFRVLFKGYVGVQCPVFPTEQSRAGLDYQQSGRHQNNSGRAKEGRRRWNLSITP